MQTAFVGIDVGKAGLVVATTYELNDRNEIIPPHFLSLSEPSWWQKLLELCPRGSVVVLEPTGWHYSAAIVKLLADYGCRPYYVDHNAASDARRYIPRAGFKSDVNDARALCQIARLIAAGDEVNGVHSANPEHLAVGLQLRTLVSAYERATKDSTRAKNRLQQLAHAISPILAHNFEHYLRFVSRGAAQPSEMRRLAAQIEQGQVSLGRGRLNKSAIDLAASLPPNLQEHPIATVLQFEVDVLNAARERAGLIQQQIKAIVSEPPLDWLTELWMTVPMAGVLDVAKVHAANYGQSEYLTFSQFKANLSSFPATVKQSGGQTIVRATYKGYKPAKIALTLWTLRLCKTDNPVSRKFKQVARRGDNLSQRGKPKTFAIARAKLVEILYSIMTNRRPYFNGVSD